jgi:hypothetical protein
VRTVATAPRAYAALLWTLTALFFTRVLGQTLVAFAGVTFLPPMSEWYSGLLPYPILLPVQVAMLAVMAAVDGQIAAGAGVLARPRRRLGRGLRVFACVYFAGMVIRYVLTMAFHPERRWLHGTIPIVFHWVLAGYLWTLGTYYSRMRSAE